MYLARISAFICFAMTTDAFAKLITPCALQASSSSMVHDLVTPKILKHSLTAESHEDTPKISNHDVVAESHEDKDQKSKDQKRAHKTDLQRRRRASAKSQQDNTQLKRKAAESYEDKVQKRAHKTDLQRKRLAARSQ